MYLFSRKFQAATIIPLTAQSAGTKFAYDLLSMYTDLMTPFPPPTNSPMGPWRLLHQPGKGSSNVGITAKDIN